MEENSLLKETNQVIEKLKSFMALEGLKKNFSMESYLAKERFEVEISHQYLTEMSNYLHAGHVLSIPSLLDLEPLFTALEKKGMLSAIELSNIRELLSSSEALYDQLCDKREYRHLNDDALDLNSLPSLRRELESDIEPDFTISDNASAKLKEIRSEKRSLMHNLTSIMTRYKNKYASYLTSDTIHLKGDEETLPVKVQYKNTFKGTIISYSSSGETAFMVPYEVLDLRNRLRSLLDDEMMEVTKVLADLSQKCSKQLKILQRDYEILMNFDRYYSAVSYGNSINGTISTLSDNDFVLTQLFHPLLNAKKVVTNSIALGDKNPKAFVITGPNAGGKSVLIKAVALSVMMDKLGLMVPCHEEAKIPFMDDVYFLGGDNQSVLDNLSTFSSHLIGIKEIVDKASKNSLVIIDEVGEGTSPKDGEALGVALLKYFEKLDCFTLLTSHFDGMKIYAASDPKALTGAMEFNGNNLTPTFRLLLNTTGKSYGIQLAKNIGLKEEIIQDALAFKKQRSQRDTDALLEKLTEQESENQKLKRSLENKGKDLDRLIEKKQQAIIALNNERSNIHQKAQEKVERLVEQRLKEMDEIWKNTNHDKTTYSEFSKTKGELNKLKEVEKPTLAGKPEPVLLTDLKEGDLVEDEDGRRATVIEIKKKDVLLDMDGLRFRRPIAGLKRGYKTAKDIKKKPKGEDYTSIILSSSQGIELNVIGLHVDEAMRKIVSFIDNARVRKLASVRIIHGMGSFALKNALWKYLENHKAFFSSWRLGGEGEGGMGATIIHLK